MIPRNSLLIFMEFKKLFERLLERLFQKLVEIFFSETPSLLFHVPLVFLLLLLSFF